MGKHIRTILIVIAAFILIAFAGYRMNLYPVQIAKDTADELQQKIEDISEDAAGSTSEEGTTESKSIIRQFYDTMDSGMESKDSSGESNPNATDFEKSLECFYVESIVDGDTIWVSNDNHAKGIKVRYIGIDTPESVHSDESKNTREGKLASKRNEEIIADAGYEVYLEYDKDKEDDYERTLAYVYIYNDGEYLMIEDILLSEGMCRTMTIKPNTKYEEHFKALEDEAKSEGAGFWGTGYYK